MALTKVSRGLLSTGIVDNSTTTAITIDSSENVGIGTSSPTAKAHIYDASTDAVLYLDSANVNGSHARFLASGSVKHFVGSGGGFGLGDVDDFAIRSFDNLIFATNNSSTERMRIDSSGNVQIGTGTPAYLVGTGDIAQLSVNRVGTSGAITNTARSAAFINLNGANGGSSIEFSTASANNTAPTERMRIDASGSVGIGKTPLGNNLSPALEMVSGGTMFGYGDAMYLTGNLYYNGGWKAIATGAGSSMILDASGPKFYTNASASAGGTVTPTERMRIDASGSVGIGTTSFSIYGQTSGTGALAFKADDGTTGGSLMVSNNADRSWAPIYLNKFAWNSGDDSRLMQFYINAGADSATLEYDGTNFAIVNPSDYRLKENVVSYTGGLAKINAIGVKSFNKIDGVSSHITQEGFIAHELKAVIPLAVIGEKDAMKTNESGEVVPDYQRVNKETLIPYLVSAIQELSAKVETLEAKVQTLENN